MSSWTFGTELELSDCERDTPLPGKSTWDVNDYTIVNSNGVANDPKAILWKFGGEINTEPATSVDAQVEVIAEVLKALRPAPMTNYRSNLHVHIRVPGLAEDLGKLQRILSYTQAHGQQVFDLVDPLPAKPDDAPATKRWKRRKRSHHYLLTEKCYQRAMSATTLSDFRAAHAPLDYSGTPMFHLVQRSGVNLLSLWKHQTIEFRHFSLSLNLDELRNAIRWCQVFLEAALGDQPEPKQLLWPGAVFPVQPLYDYWLEPRYQATTRKNHTDAEITATIEKWRQEGTL